MSLGNSFTGFPFITTFPPVTSNLKGAPDPNLMFQLPDRWLGTNEFVFVAVVVVVVAVVTVVVVVVPDK